MDPFRGGGNEECGHSVEAHSKRRSRDALAATGVSRLKVKRHVVDLSAGSWIDSIHSDQLI